MLEWCHFLPLALQDGIANKNSGAVYGDDKGQDEGGLGGHADPPGDGVGQWSQPVLVQERRRGAVLPAEDAAVWLAGKYF